MGDLVQLLIGGKLYAGWTSVSIDTGIDHMAAAFDLQLTEREPGTVDRRDIKAGAACEVRIGGEVVITGYIDQLAPSFDNRSHTISARGRSRAGDLIDCSAVASPGHWSGRTIDKIAAALVAPFGLKVTARAPVGAPFRRFALQPGETVFEALSRMARFRGLLAVSTPAGDIELITPAASPVGYMLAHPGAILAAKAVHDVTDRFGRYIVKGQAAGDDSLNGRAAAAPKAEAQDLGVARYRPLIVVAEDQSTSADLTIRARWEAQVRAARAQQVQITVQGWRAPDGTLWQSNVLVPVRAPWLSIDASLLVVGVSFRLDAEGSRTELTLAPPEAYSLEPIPAASAASTIERKRRGQS